VKTLVVATRNLAKGGEMVTILRELLPAWLIKTLNDYPEFAEPEETGTTYEENAIIKAEAARDFITENRKLKTENPILFIADDAGLEIEALEGAPGVHSKRFGGEDMPFPEKIQLILSSLQGKPRAARFRCCVAIAANAMATKVFEATKDGVIAEALRGEGGFGYDSIFVLPELGKTYAELSPEHKNTISHRFLVLKQAAEYLKWRA
jgi:XTP/dITP diphosphohydrolase